MFVVVSDELNTCNVKTGVLEPKGKGASLWVCMLLNLIYFQLGESKRPV